MSTNPRNAADGQHTIRSVAEYAGVSKSLVSRVLQGSPHVRPEKRKAVEDAIKELGYRPNGAARSLTERRTRAIGVLVNDLRQPWFVDFLEGVNTALTESDLHMFVGDGRLDRHADERLMRAFMEMRVDGLILAGTMPESTTITEAASRLPTAVAGSRDFKLPNVDVIAEDDGRGVELVMRHLFDLGHRRIAHIAGNHAAVFGIRRRAYETIMREHGYGDHVLVETCDTTEDGGYRAAVRLLGRARPRPTALFVANDPACVGAFSAAVELGLSVPGDLSLASFDNSFLAKIRHLSLTSVDIGAHEVGRRVTRVLLDRIAEPERTAVEYLVTPTLEVRSSTGPVPRPEIEPEAD
ncbi:LacI family DNA-binding transcriptional regulator [Streptomyces sp. NPDC096132]|uniref:LacI family DNA-binding transcriptional regulator n=1 Tax=Streptomyces sp. NPDC096132 TaxID=3366075 RepID=UPI003812C360